ncbi:hypothetical protein FNV43_RR05002 [Rhamnella rubrinervis]|uniref:GRPD C-terminal domain-containing protein n=1 Tax=Rhamnella rubrinervis TaxID=2594499 RepID=A0A8K0HLV4_9ROSA|nr:hypothetical protein FNV43_RR05002 [Rhamnella rubrinervis]
MSTRSLSEISETETIRVGVDLVSAARQNVGFLRAVADSHWLHQKPVVVEAIRRYDELWMPLISDLTVGSTLPMILPPVDVEWVWFCQTLNPLSYKKYCETKFSKLIGKPGIFDEENEDYALMRCREMWESRYPNEPFENEGDSCWRNPVICNEELLVEVSKHRFFFSKFSEPYRSEIAYLIAARQRYKGFLYMVQRTTNVCSGLVPASDIMLMWLTHQSYPTIYAEDSKEIEGGLEKVVPIWGTIKGKEVEETKNLWETTFDQSYEKAGGGIVLESEIRSISKPPIYWNVSDTDFNTKYKSMLPRFLLEVCVFVRLKARMKAMKEEVKGDILRLRMVRCHRELKLDKTISSVPYKSWKKAWHLYCEFGTKGLILELRRHGGFCFKGSGPQESVAFHWNDLLRAPSLTLEREVDQQLKIVASITPPVQAPYLLKCVPDRVTDDSGAMISDVILRMNQYRPQEGRWLSRTVLDHAGRECFVIRIRVGGGFWRRGGETPSAVKWEDRIIEIQEGSWSYVAGAIGRAPEKVVATATPREPPEQWKAAWYFSTGDELLLRWESSPSLLGLSFCLRNQATESTAKLLKGRKMQYQVLRNKKSEYQNEEENTEEDDEEEGFVTLVRFTEDDPTGRATALLNWKLLVVELMPEEDAILVLLLCISILRSVSDMKKEDLGRLLIRRRLKEARIGMRDWGSVILHPSSSSSSTSSPFVEPWYWNAKAVLLASDSAADHVTKQPAFSYSPEEGGDKLYRRWIFS